MKKIIITILTLIVTHVFAHTNFNIHTADVDLFWKAYDSIKQVDDYPTKITLINSLFLEKESVGLKKFREMMNYNDSSYIRMIEKYPSYFKSIRPNVEKLLAQKELIRDAFLNFEKQYPDLKPVDIYFTMGCFNSGGTISDNMILLGSEILAADSTTRIVHPDHNWLKNMSRHQTIENVGFFVLHEYVHVLQKKTNGIKVTVLPACIGEGAADFIAEAVTGRPLTTFYREYGEQHLQQVKDDFKKEMFSTDISKWLYNGPKMKEAADLGYFVGYAICKSYYEHASDKTQAIKDILALDYADNGNSGFFLQI